MSDREQFFQVHRLREEVRRPVDPLMQIRDLTGLYETQMAAGKSKIFLLREARQYRQTCVVCDPISNRPGHSFGSAVQENTLDLSIFAVLCKSFDQR